MPQSCELHTDVLLKPSGGGPGGVSWQDGVVSGLEAAPGKSVPCIVPAFVDPHVHLILGARHTQRVDFSNCSSRVDFTRCLEMAHRDQPDGWLIAGGWDAGRLGATPDRLWLEHVGDRPCVLWSRDIHVAVVNDAVLAQLDVSPIEGGCFHRDDTGQLTGRLDEAAAWHRLNPIIPEPSPSSDRFCVEQAVPLLHSRGILGIGSMEYFRHVESVLAQGVPGLDLSITLLDRSDEVDATSLRERFDQHENLVLSGMKSFADGTLGSRTAWMDTPWTDGAPKGWPLDHTAEGTLAAWARQVRAEALDPAVHAIGSAAVAAVLDAFESAEIVSGRVEHAQFVRDVDLPRFQGHWCSMQPTHHVDDAREIAKCADPALAFRFRSLHEAGGQLVFSSDWPVVEADPLRAMLEAVRPDRSESVGVMTALEAVTSAAARMVRLPDPTLRVGGPASFVALDEDPRKSLLQGRVPNILATVRHGQVVYGDLP